jgi:hypothetical protein
MLYDNQKINCRICPRQRCIAKTRLQKETNKVAVSTEAMPPQAKDGDYSNLYARAQHDDCGTWFQGPGNKLVIPN